MVSYFFGVEELRSLAQVPRGSRPGLFIEFIPFLKGFFPREGIVEQKNFANDHPSDDLHQVLDDQAILRGLLIHIFQYTLFGLP